MSALFLRRSALAVSRRAVARPAAARPFSSSIARRDAKHNASSQPSTQMKPFEDITSEHDLLPPGAAPGTVPTDLEQATGLERLEILGKMQGVDIFDMRPLDNSRKGTMDNPIPVKSFGEENYAGCCGPVGEDHVVHWLTVSRHRPIERCPECGSVYKIEYVGPQDDGHGHDDHGHHETYEEPKTMADFIKPEYRYN